MNFTASLWTLLLGTLLFSCNRKLAPDNQILNVRSFGAKGDGITNDYNSIQRAIAKLQSLGRGVLYFPKGIYKVVGNKDEAEYLFQLRNLSNVEIKGASKETTVIKACHGQVEISRHIFQIRNVDHLSFENINFQGQYTLTTKDPPNAKQRRRNLRLNYVNAIMFLDECNHIEFSNTSFKYFFGPALQFSNTGHGLNISKSDFSDLMREVTGDGRNQPQPTGILINRGMANITIDSCTFKNIIDVNNGKKSHAVYLASVKNVLITNSLFMMDSLFSFHDTRCNGIQIYSGHSQDIKITENRFNNVHSHLSHGQDIVFQNNKLINSRLVIGSSNIQVLDNSFILSRQAGGLGLVRNAGRTSNAQIKGNTFSHLPHKSTFSYAIQLYDDCINCIVSDNIVKNFHTGILLGQRSNEREIVACRIVSNLIICGVDSWIGINLYSGRENLISQNIFRNESVNLIQSVRDYDLHNRSERNKVYENSIEGKRVKSALLRNKRIDR